MRVYAGVTVGPIVETLMMSSTPGGMWFSSFFFSTVVGTMCEKLEPVGTVLTVPPGHDYETSREERPGIGQYHDRLNLVTETEDDETQARKKMAESLENARSEMIQSIAKDLGKALEGGEEASPSRLEEIRAFLESYLQIHYVVLTEAEVEKKGIAQSLADALDALELMCFPMAASAEEAGENLLRLITSGDENRSNRYIAKYPPLVRAAINAAPFPLAEVQGGASSLDATQAEKNAQVRVHDLTYIASHGRASSEEVETGEKTLKKDERYFAIVQCDGDNMGKLLKNYELEPESTAADKRIAEEAHIQRISKLCMQHTAKSVELVHRYGGVVIYAGGEDLLFLAPLFRTPEDTPREGGASEAEDEKVPKNVWALCAKLDENFQQAFTEMGFKQHGNDPLPTLSFGVSVNYIKFPLYEAFSDAYDLMEFKAKALGRKHNMAVKLHKHSGQTAGFIASLSSDTMKAFLENVDSYQGTTEKKQQDTEARREGEKSGQEKNAGNQEDMDRVVHSVLYHMENYRALFEEALSDKNAETLKTLMQNAFDNAGQIVGNKDGADQLVNVAARYTDLAGAIGREYDENEDDTLVIGMSEGEENKKPKYPRLHALTSMLRVAKLTVEGGDMP